MKSLFKKSSIFSILLGLTMTFAQQPNYPTQAVNAQVVYSDLENFVSAFDHLKKNTDTIQVLNTYYFEKASPGLKEYINRHKLTPEMLKEALQKDPEEYAGISTFIDELNNFEIELTEIFKRFKEVIPKTMFAPTYLLVGANRGIAQASQFGQLVTITRLLDNKDRLLKVIVHELAHFQQAMTLGGPQYVALYSQPDNMLGICLREGGAEFITGLVLDGITQEKSMPYYIENEIVLKDRFIDDLKTQNNSFWLWDSIGQKDRPQLLGYVMGYKIWSSYYKELGDKDQVINEILNLIEPDKYIEKSKYFSE
jgi:hypothetical protein